MFRNMLPENYLIFSSFFCSRKSVITDILIEVVISHNRSITTFKCAYYLKLYFSCSFDSTIPSLIDTSEHQDNFTIQTQMTRHIHSPATLLIAAWQ